MLLVLLFTYFLSFYIRREQISVGGGGANSDSVLNSLTLTTTDEYIDEEGVRWVAQRPRPNISLMNHYQCTWKPRNNHFLRYQDVKPKGKSSTNYKFNFRL